MQKILGLTDDLLFLFKIVQQYDRGNNVLKNNERNGIIMSSEK